MSTRDKYTVGGAGVGAVGGALLTDGSTLGTVGGAAVGGIVGKGKNEGTARRLFVNPLAVWSNLAIKTGEAMLASAHAAAARTNALRVAVIPTADAPPARGKVRSKTKTGGKTKRRAKR